MAEVTAAVVPAPSASGRVPGRAGGIGIVVEHHWRWYRRNWRATVVSSVLQPLLFLLAFGVGFGALVSGSGRVEVATGGVGYLVWLAPALLAMSAVQSAAFESTYPVLSGFKWQRVYHAMAAGPLSAAQIGLGHLTWIALKMFASGAVYVIVIAVFGGVTGPGVAVSLVAATFTGTAVAALVMAFAATVENEGSAFTGLFRFVVIPMTLFSGTFFPVDRLPAVVRPLAWVSPLWHGTELARSAALGRWQPLAAAGHVAFLLVLLVIGAVLVARQFRRRLTP
ncbi:ABC transporter permease [Pseudonocardia asaccharolytica]|uniref:Transport permease protein n=1 Tax=Pseudonocardia asaccharolytica DSM 44247 = NBRC 16224 TaxID=1123024 RepID=A0A511CZV9_9PSEU|nr:ABC transporter permease [Pseudonocardia asaccharolytica]GEL16814.1 transport permease protein [Pseudonocardia asaccharolytica DSM 44247 = NBRC 16224]